MASFFATQRLQSWARLLWGLVLVTLPVTSFRYMPDFLGRTLIQPLAFYPLALLLPVLLVLFWRERRVPVPSNINLLLALLLVLLITSLISILYAPIQLRGASIDERILRGWFSLLIGLAFFFAAFWMTRSEKDLNAALKWIYAALALTIAWSLVQAIAVNTSLIPRSLVNQIQTLFSARPLLPRRISGFAYEPAWLADQIVIFFMPWVFAAFVTGRHAFKQKWVELALILLAMMVLVFTYSRGGLLTAVLCIGIIVVFFGRRMFSRAWAWLMQPFRTAKSRARAKAGCRALGVAGRVALFAAVVVGLVAAGAFLSRYDYFSSLWDLGDEENPVDYLVDISAGPRLGYALAGYQVFEDKPLTGVGLGASGLYLFPHYPDWARTIPEVARQLSPDSNLIPNIKNLYVRLLAEGGLPSFWFFVVFFVSFLALIRRMAISGRPFYIFVAAAGLFAWVGIAARNFTQDSLTIPIMWVTLGMLAGLYPFVMKELRFGRTK